MHGHECFYNEDNTEKVPTMLMEDRDLASACAEQAWMYQLEFSPDYFIE